MTSYAQYPYATLQQLGGRLTGISDTLSQSNKGASDVDGLTSDQQRISDAIGGFRGEWEESVRQLGENIGNLGELSNQIGQLVGGFDQSVADALRPGGGGGAPSGAV